MGIMNGLTKKTQTVSTEQAPDAPEELLEPVLQWQRNEDIKVFLGGTCNGSTWRTDKVIPYLKINHFNPVKETWTEDDKKEERRQRNLCDYLLYVITPKQKGMLAYFELLEDTIKRPKNTLVVFLDSDDGTVFDDDQQASIDAAKEVVINNGGLVFNTIVEAIKWINPRTEVSTEEASGKTEREREYCMYIEVANVDELANAIRHEDMDQWSVSVRKNAAHPYSGCIRTRSINSGEKYILTFKVKEGSEFGVDETEMEVSKDFHRAMLCLCESGMVKRRYFFPVEGIPGKEWHLDMFYVNGDPDGKFYPWARLELEVDEGEELDVLPTPPVSTTRTITHIRENRTQEESDIVGRVMSEWFIVPNPYLDAKK